MNEMFWLTAVSIWAVGMVLACMHFRRCDRLEHSIARSKRRGEKMVDGSGPYFVRYAWSRMIWIERFPSRRAKRSRQRQLDAMDDVYILAHGTTKPFGWHW
ncbi:hypothetical protein RBI13_18700 [Alcaligenaceae bacterium A4P071]|nr:hypothetical protein [Alcaligenaceae bacterium A4P071]